MTKSIKISIFITFILASLVTFFCSSLFRSQYILVSIQMISSATATHRLYWSSDGKAYNSANSKSFSSHLINSPETLEIKIPATQVRKMQLNLNAGNLDTGYIISSLKINGTDYLKDAKFYNLDKKGTYLSTKGTNPSLSISLPEKSPLKAQSHIDWLPLAALFIISLILIFNLLYRFFIPFYLSSQPQGQILFPCLISVILLVPLLGTHVHETMSVQENRNLAPPPNFQTC